MSVNKVSYWRIWVKKIQRFLLMLRVLPPMKQTCLAQIRFLQVAESKEYFYFLQRNLYTLRVLPAHGKLVLQQVT